MLAAYANSWRIPELRKRILFTAGIIALCRLTANIPCPGIDAGALAELFRRGNEGSGGVLDMFNLFSGGALERFAVGALGIMPYISASIIMQLMMPVIPTLEKMVREGESGRQKFNQITRYVTVVICVIQGAIFATAMMRPEDLQLGGGGVVLNPGPSFVVMSVITLTAGAMFIMWLGEMITERGIGNGASLIITVNIVDRLPRSLQSLWKLWRSGGDITVIHVLILFAMFFLVCGATVAITQGHRKIPVRYARRMAGRTGVSAGTTSYLPLRINYSGVMPIIFAGAILSIPTMVLRVFPRLNAFLGPWFAYGNYRYMLLYSVMILLFSFFWVANQFNPVQIADDLQKRGGYIPGIRPGQPTAEFLDNTMTRITLAGAIFLTLLAIMPMFLYQRFRIPPLVAQFFGGTSLLIIVGVMLDTMRQVESHLLSRHYDGFLKKGHLRSRRGR
ncbi:MAG: preprotein translocase subunit SecY [Lentisphaeria bacterium]|nr:preprotein translocase subunit SecY [Lentisphaeria bacterium]